MKSVTVRCPECNAVLEAGAETREVRCSYCNTLVVIQRRTTFLQRPAPLPTRLPDAQPARVVTEPRHVFPIVVLALVPLALLGLAVVQIAECNKGGSPWGKALLLEDGEHFLALLKSRDPEILRLAAYDARTGKRRWRTAELRSGHELSGALCVAGELVLDGDRGPGLTAVNLADGKIRWRARLGEAVTGLCAGPDGKHALVRTADDKHHLLSLADGTVKPAMPSSTCAPLRCAVSGRERVQRLDHRESQRWKAALRGMTLDDAIPAGGVSLVLGHKTPGTRVPMVAVVRPLSAAPARPRPGDFTGGHGPGVEVLWQATVPAGDPLAAKSDAPRPDQVAIDDKAVAVAYELHDDSKHRLTVFSRNDGKRRIDVALPKEMRAVWSILLTPETVIAASTWGMIAAYDLASGKELYTID